MKKSVYTILWLNGIVWAGCADTASIETAAVSSHDDVRFADVVTSYSDSRQDADEPIQKTESDSELLAISCEIGEECDDGNPCTTEDYCADEGECLGTIKICDDGLSCTVDTCDDEGTCKSAISAGKCLIDNVCMDSGMASDTNQCMVCIPSVSPTTWSAEDFRDCDDGNACSVGDRCIGGACLPKYAQCADDNPCTLDICESEDGCSYVPIEALCEDGDSCTVGDFCEKGTCLSGGDLLDCDDDNPCTKDACSADGCSSTVVDGACQDGNPCTTNDYCEEGACQAGEITDLGCEDNNPCTDSGCDPNTGCIYIANSDACNDGNACTLGDVCAGTQCIAGEEPLDCDDGNFCTSDSCVKSVGCVFTNNSFGCDDGDECSTLDLCSGGSCIGSIPLLCEDGDLCTDDTCDSESGCTYTNNSKPCDDGSLCTFDDECSAGDCLGTAVSCDDGNACSADACDGATGECVFSAIVSATCLPGLTIDSPKRGAAVQNAIGSSVNVAGTFTSPGGVPSSFTLEHFGSNGPIQTVSLLEGDTSSDSSFAADVEPELGMNVVRVTLTDGLGAKATRTHSFFYSPDWIAPDETGVKEDGLVILLGEDVIDDGDRNLPVDDLGTAFELVTDGIDLSSLLAGGGKLASETIAGVDVDVYATDLTYGDKSVSLDPNDGSLLVTLTLTDLKIDLLLEYEICAGFFGCTQQEISGDASVSSVQVSTEIVLALDEETGELIAASESTTAEVASNFDVNLDGFLGGLVEFIVGFLDNDFAGDLESTLEQQVDELLPPLFSTAFSTLQISEFFSFPPLFGGNTTVDVVFESALSNLEFFEEGGRVALESAANPAASLDKVTLGSIQRANCLSLIPEPLPFFDVEEFGVGLHDDVFNRLLFAVWNGGGLEFPVSEDALGTLDLDALGIDELDVTLEFLAPPVVSGCTDNGNLEIQIGDMAVYASLNFGVIPLDVDIFVSVRAEAEFTVVNDDGVQELGLSVNEVTFLETDMVFEDPTQVVFEDALVTLIEAELVPTFLGTLTEGAIGGIPLPVIDLSGIAEELNGVELELNLQSIEREGGYSMLLGGVK